MLMTYRMEKKEGDGYLRLRYSLYPSISFTYSKPASISLIALSLSLVALHVHSSEFVWNRADSRFM